LIPNNKNQSQNIIEQQMFSEKNFKEKNIFLKNISILKNNLARV